MKVEAWASLADKALSRATEQIQLIRSVTPQNADAELVALEHDFRRGARRLPAWQYEAPKVQPELIPALMRLADHLESQSSPLSSIYAARARELAQEGAVVLAVGTPSLTEHARERFLGSSDDDRQVASRAHAQALAWSAGVPSADPCAQHERLRSGQPDVDLVRSCDHSHPGSLVSAMAREAGRAHLPIRVIVQPGLASLAATGDGFILIAQGRFISARATARTVLHEIEGHAQPRARAAQQALRIYVLGTARGVDDQEGRALLIERAAGFLDGERQRELAWRHLAAEQALAGGTFVDSVDLLLSRGAPLVQALRIAARVHRGGSGAGGLGREVVYLTALLRVERSLAGAEAAIVERVMSCGRIAAGVAPWLAGSHVQRPTYDSDLRRFAVWPTI